VIEVRAALLDDLLHHRFTKREVRAALRWLKANYPHDLEILQLELSKVEVLDTDDGEYREPKYRSDYTYPTAPPEPGKEVLSLWDGEKDLGYVIYTAGKGWKFYSKVTGVVSRFLTSQEYSETPTEAIPPKIYARVSGIYPAPQLHRSSITGWFTYSRD
jgi:hypothetical protein